MLVIIAPDTEDIAPGPRYRRLERHRGERNCRALGFLNVAFGTVPLELEQWLACVAIASVVLWASELRKLAGRVFRRPAA